MRHILLSAILVFSLFLFPCWAFQINTESFLILLGQDREIAKIAGQYMLIFTPGLIGIFMQNVLLRYLRAQNILWPTMIIGCLGVAVNALSHYLLVLVAEMGTDGSAISQVLAFYSIVFGCLVYIIGFKKYKQTWGGWTWDAFQEWGLFLKLALGGMCAVMMEFFSFEAGTILAGILGEVQLAAQSIMFQIDILAYMIPLGVGVAANIRVGQLLGAGDKEQVKRVIKVAYLLVHIFVVVAAILIVTLRFEIPKIFSGSPAVIEYTSNLMIITAIYFVIDGCVAVGQGILRGSGRQLTCAFITLVAFYLIGLPMGIPLMFLTSIETAGYWWGLVAGMLVTGTSLLVIVLRTDWDEMIKLARERTTVKDRSADEIEDNTIHETTALLADKRESEDEYPGGRHIAYCDRAVSSSDLRKPLPTPHYEPFGPQLLFKRTIFILLMVLTLALGIFIRFNFYYPDLPAPMEVLCTNGTSNNGTSTNGTSTNTTTTIPLSTITLPLCNYTTVVL
ncbi:multidrug and toxin extrusion protein 1-like isoform X2 [Lineus longissimus]|uniref:multidrug and toxin extrusion protein 1-like isoform X2 n=1 Tax=Lineus longissimus TaxID=88925 RepID=UPI00315DB6C4